MTDLQIATLIIGIIGAICIGAFSIPGLARILKTKDTASVSLTMYIILMCGGFLFILMSILGMIDANNVAIIGVTVGNLVSFAIALTVVILKGQNMKSAKHYGMSEKQWCDKLALEAKARKEAKKNKKP